jgi:hypothetical protein
MVEGAALFRPTLVSLATVLHTPVSGRQKVIKCTQSYTEFAQSLTEKKSIALCAKEAKIAARSAIAFLLCETLWKLRATLCALDDLLVTHKRNENGIM